MTQIPTTSRYRGRSDRGTIYIVVLVGVMLVTVIGLWSVSLLRVRTRSQRWAADSAQASLLAQTGIEVGLNMIASSPSWRTDLGNGQWRDDSTLDVGSYILEAQDPVDGDVTVGEGDPVMLTATGKKGDSRHKARVRVEFTLTPMDSLSSALHAGRTINFNGATATADAVISTNGSMYASSSTINADVEAAGWILGWSYNGSKESFAGSRELPPTSVVDDYAERATPIDIADLPVRTVNTGSGDVTISYLEELVLSPASNPYGPPDAAGIYVVNCKGLHLRITNCRIVGTLVILNPGSYTQVEGSVCWEQAGSNKAVLLVGGPCGLLLSQDPLDEAAFIVNFNPPGTPYQGTEDVDQLDAYPSNINGLIYAADDLAIGGETRINGTILTNGEANIGGSLTIMHDADLLTTPPDGFTSGSTARLATTSHARIVE
jgi:hypothetical protein